MLSLHGYGRDMPLMRGSLFFTCRTCVYPTVAAVVADAVNRGRVDHCCVVYVVDDRGVYVVHRTVVVKPSVVPSSAFITVTEVTVAIADPTIETYMRTPVAIIENEFSATPTPIAWRPKQTDFRSDHPRTGHPVVIIITPSPIPRCPEITVAGANRLLVDGQLRRADGNRYADLCGRSRRQRQHYECEQKRTDGKNIVHCRSLYPIHHSSPTRCCFAARCGLRARLNASHSI